MLKKGNTPIRFARLGGKDVEMLCLGGPSSKRVIYKRKYVKGKLASAPASPQECALRGQLVNGTFEVIPIPYDPETLEFEMTIPDDWTCIIYSGETLSANGDSAKFKSKIKELKVVAKNTGDLKWAFNWCNNLTEIDVSEYDVSEVTSLSAIFNRVTVKHIDLSTWDISKVTMAADVLTDMPNLESANMGDWDLSNAESLLAMVATCTKLKALDLSKSKTPKVTNFGCMFYYDWSLASLNISNFDFSSATDVGLMFYYCTALKDLHFGKNLKISLSLSQCPLTHESAVSVLNGLAQVSTPQTITFKSTTYATLTSEEIALATSKGWTVASA